MNFLQLAQRLRQECAGQGLGPTAVTNQSGKNKLYVDWTSAAWLDIQNLRDGWKFLWDEFEFNTVDTFGDYNPDNADVASWSRQATIFETALGTSDKTPLPFRRYDEWRDLHEVGYSEKPNDRPQEFTILPNNHIRLTPAPDGIYTIGGARWLRPQIFAANADVPRNVDERHHLIIVWYAMAMHYAGFEDAAEVKKRGDELYRRSLYAFDRDYRPEIVNGACAVGEN